MTGKILSASTSELIKFIWQRLSRRRRRQFALTSVLTIISAFAEVICLGAVLPFLGILTAPELVFRHPIVKKLALAWGIHSPAQLVLPLTLAFVGAAVLAALTRILLVWANTRLACSIGADLSAEMYQRTLYQSYCVHVSRNTNEIISAITIKVNAIVYDTLLQLLVLNGAIAVLVAITITLIIINPAIALIAGAGFGGCYGLIAWLSRHRLHKNSRSIAHEHDQVIKALREGLGGIRDVLLDGTQSVYCGIYRQADHPLRKAQGNNIFISESPRYAIEAFGTVLIAVLAFGLSRRAGGLGSALPVLGALAFGAQRLLPALQQSYNAWARIAGSRASLIDTIALLDQPVPSEFLLAAPAPIAFQNEILFKRVSFRYAGESALVLDGLDLVIPKGARVGFAGTSGSGKSTLLDLFLGLLTPSEGEIQVDGQRICDENTRAWQRHIAHVPQNIYLADSTILENIAFGIPYQAIDVDRVKHAAQRAQIADFIEACPKGYHTLAGERGIRMSGGQRQRLGIARALYKHADVLVFDEATSALDNPTEQSVMDAIADLDNQLTILLVAHRLTTLKICDFIVLLAEGKVMAQGSYDELMATSPEFRRLARATL